MAKTPHPYTRLTRDGASVGTVASLWLAEDHLIVVRSSGHHEDYTRFELTELQGVFLTVTSRRIWWALWWGVFAVPSLITVTFALLRGGQPIVSVFFLVVGGVGLLWNHLLGPGCRAYVLTGVQTTVLPSLVRMNKARKVLRRLAAKVAEAQAALVTPVASVAAVTPTELRRDTPPAPPPVA